MANHWEERTVRTDFGDITLKGIPALRSQISLNGVWEEGGEVPVYGGIDIPQQNYERWVDVPADWDGQVIKLAFLAVNVISDIYIDGQKIHTNINAWVPFDVEITGYVSAGQRFRLRVDVKSQVNEPILNADGIIQYPTGMGGMDHRHTGIADDVWLRAYAPVHIEDAFIKTSWRKDQIQVDYTLVNTTERAVQLKIKMEIIGADDGFSEKEFRSKQIVLLPGERKLYSMTQTWYGRPLWFPDTPKLYHLTSSLLAGEELLDRETRRFGFREIWVEGNQYYLNGVRVNLFGSYDPYATNWYTNIADHIPDTYPNTVAKMKYLNMRINRWHMHPPAQYLLDISDEMGLMIHCESILYARGFMLNADKEVYFENSRKWMRYWITANRNHASIVKWGACNEMSYPSMVGDYDYKRLIGSLADEILKYDDTRPINYDGEEDVGRETVDYHYLEGYNKEPYGSMYDWERYVYPDKPTGSGEIIHLKSPDQRPALQNALARCRWWIGIWMRGMRYINFTDVRPACYWFVRDDIHGAQAALLRNAYAPVALFDKEYDDLGIAPIADGIVPKLRANSVEERTLILYNDEFRGKEVRVIVAVRVDGKIVSSSQKKVVLPLGEHVEIPVWFTVPNAPGKEIELVLATEKGDRKTFEESKRFLVTENEFDGDLSGIGFGR